nr:MAG TPA: hypothetical protein [Caudoviricetes sp.]
MSCSHLPFLEDMYLWVVWLLDYWYNCFIK